MNELTRPSSEVLAGESRRWYHGLPRVFTPGEGMVDAAGEALAPPR